MSLASAAFKSLSPSTVDFLAFGLLASIVLSQIASTTLRVAILFRLTLLEAT